MNMGGTIKRTLEFIFLISSIRVNLVAGETQVVESFVTNEIVPDIISKAPNDLIYVSYPSGAEVNLGAELTPTQVKDAPAVSWEADSDKFYTLAFVDPDAPSRENPANRSWQHWLVVNIPCNNLTLGDTLSAYVGAGPSQGSGFHRYVFIVYEQPSMMVFDEPLVKNSSRANRSGFSIAAFSRKYNLGDPSAGNFFEAQYDEYVPILMQQLGA